MSIFSTKKLSFDKISQIALISVFFLPLIITPGVLFPYQYGKVVIFEAVVGILFALVLYSTKWSLFKATPIFISYAVFLAVRFFTGIIGDNPEKSFWGDHIRMTGTFTLLLVFMFFLLLRHFFSGAKSELKLLRAISISGVISIILAVTQRYTAFGGAIFGSSGAWLFGSFGNPSYFASFLVLIIFFTGALVLRENKLKIKLFWASVGFAELAVLMATSSRGAIVGLLLGAMIGGIALLVRSKNRIVRGAGIIGIGMPVILLASSLFIYFVLGRNSAPGEVLGSLLRSGTAESRLINWKIALDGFSAKPFFGWGPENYEILFSKFYRPELVMHSYAETWSDRPHNILFEIATGSGVIGLVSYLVFLATPLWILLFRKMDSTLNGEIALFAGAIAAFLGQGLFLFDTFGALILFAAILALIDMRYAQNNANPRMNANDANMRIRAPVLSAVAILGFVIFGTVLPVKASIFAARSQRDIARRDYAGFKNNFLSALNSKTPHHDDLAKILGDDILKGDASAALPPEVIKSVLIPLAEYLEASANSHPNVYALVFRSAEVFALAGEYIDPEYFKKSEVMFERAEALSPRRQTTAMMRVQMELTRGNNGEARRRIVSLIETDPDFSEARWLYGLVLIAAGEASAAEEQFDLFFSRRGRGVDSPTTIGIFKKTNFILDFYASRGSFDKMVPILESFVGTYPNVADQHMRLAAVYATLGRFSEARVEALKTVSLDPSRKKDVEEFISAIEEISNRP